MSAAITPVQAVMSILHTNDMALIWVFALVFTEKILHRGGIFMHYNTEETYTEEEKLHLHRGALSP